MFEAGDTTASAFPCEIVSEISGGSMAKLFVAQLKNTEHLFIVKAAEKKNGEMLKQEAKMLGQFCHPGIPQLFGFFEEKEMDYYIMSYHKGVHLEQYISSQGLLHECEVKWLILRLCEVLAYVHQKGVVHGDIKPSNLLYNSIDRHIVLLDFGTAEYDAGNKIQTEGRCGRKDRVLFQGTLGYAAPECWHREQYSKRQTIDIFALGALLFYLLEGKEPKEHYGRFILSDAQKKNRWQPVLNKCCALTAENRYQSPAEVFEVVKKICV